MKKGTAYIVNVPVANLWTTNQSPRKIDIPVLDNPNNMSLWFQGLDYNQKLELCTNNLVQSQVLFAQEVLVEKIQGDWAYIHIPEQASSKSELGYPGWIPIKQLTEKGSFQIDEGKIAIVHLPKTHLYDSQHNVIMTISYQTILPVKEEKEDWILVETPLGPCFLLSSDVVVYSSRNDISKGSGNNIIQEGEKFLDLEYIWGGMSGFGYDCSGFSYSMCKANGYLISRDAHEQAKEGKPIPLSDIQPGDLLFFAYEEGKGSIHHVGIYYGDNKLLHSPKTGKSVEIISMSGTLYEKELCEARRYWVERRS